MPVSDALRCVFVHIPKTGGTSVERALDLWGPWQVENRETLFGMVASADLKGRSLSEFLQHYTAAEIRDFAPGRFRDFFTFAIVRNPWDRIHSAFSKKDVNMLERTGERGLDLGPMSFDAFVAAIPLIRHVHVVPQRDFVIDAAGRTIVDFVGRYENLAADFRLVCVHLGIERALPHANRSEGRADYRAAYSPASREAVRDLYRQDIEMFGYEF